MSLPETIWWCDTHEQRGRRSDLCIMVSYLLAHGATVADLCRMIEVELHPVGTRAEIARARAFFDPDQEEE